MKRIEKKELQRNQKHRFLLPGMVSDRKDVLVLTDLEVIDPEEVLPTLEGHSRCVPVGTNLISPGGRNAKRKTKAKTALVKFRCSIFQKKLLVVKAKRSGLSLSEYCRRVAFEKEIRERFSDEHIELYKMLLKYHNNFKSIGNMFRKRDPRLSRMVYNLADEIKTHLQKFRR